MMSPPPVEDGDIYDKDYFSRFCGPLPMNRNVPERIMAAREAAARIAETLRPARVFDAGCAVGLLAEALWDQGIAAYGRDLSSYALTQAREDIRPFLEQGSIANPIEGTYDLVIAVDVLHHLKEEDALRALAQLAAAAPQLLFSVPAGTGDPRFHQTDRPLRWWLERLAELGLAPVPCFDASFLAPHALLAERTTGALDARGLMAFEALLRTRAKAQQNSAGLLKAREDLAGIQAQLAQARAASEALRAELAGGRLETERMRQALHARDGQAAAREREIRCLQQQLEGQALDLRYKAELLDAVRRHRDLLLGSSSWRLTAPLRSLLGPLSRRRQRSSPP
jgi:SAM-dependent methyltransferase